MTGMTALARILMAAAKRINAENDIKLTKVLDLGDDKLGAGVYHDKAFEEYRVLFIRDGAHLPDADYHTSDKDDAIETARAHLGEKQPERDTKEMEGAAEPGWNKVDTATEGEPKEQEERRPLPKRPRGFYEGPSSLLMNLVNRAQN